MSDITNGILTDRGRQDKEAWAAYIDKLTGERRAKALRDFCVRYNELPPHRQG